MAYQPYTSTGAGNRPMEVASPMIGQGSTFGSTVSSTLIGCKLFFFVSSHTQATFGTSDFVTDGFDLGMRPGDAVINMQIAGAHSYHRVSGITSTSVTFSAGLMISSAS